MNSCPGKAENRARCIGITGRRKPRRLGSEGDVCESGNDATRFHQSAVFHHAVKPVILPKSPSAPARHARVVMPLPPR